MSGRPARQMLPRSCTLSRYDHRFGSSSALDGSFEEMRNRRLLLQAFQVHGEDPVLTGFLPMRLKGCILGTHTN